MAWFGCSPSAPVMSPVSVALAPLFRTLQVTVNRLPVSLTVVCLLLSVVSPTLPTTSFHPRACLERIWPDFQRCRERQRDHFRYGRFTSGFSFSSDVYQPKYRTECCGYWELLECVHKAALVYCSDEVDLKKLDKFIELVGLNVPLYTCTEEFPKGSWRCKLPSWFILSVSLAVICLLVLLVLLFICVRSSK